MEKAFQRSRLCHILDSLKDELLSLVLVLLPPELWAMGNLLAPYEGQQVSDDEYKEKTDADLLQLANSHAAGGIEMHQEWAAREIAWLILCNHPAFGPRQGTMSTWQLHLARRIFFPMGFEKGSIKQVHYELRGDLSTAHWLVKVKSDKSAESSGDKITIYPGEIVQIKTIEYTYVPHDITTIVVNKAGSTSAATVIVGTTSIDPGYYGWMELTIKNLTAEKGGIEWQIEKGKGICKLAYAFTNTCAEPYQKPNLFNTTF